MSAVPIDPAVQWTLRLGLALLFTSAAWHKLRDPQRFRGALAGYALLPEGVLTPAGRALPALELATAAALLLPSAGRGGALAVGALLILYTGAVAVNLRRGRRAIDCGCGGPAAGRPIGADLLARNGLLGVAAVACALVPGSRPLVWLDAVTALAGAATLALLYAASEAALANAALRSGP